MTMSLGALMAARREAGDLVGALAAAEQLLAESRERLGPRHPDSLTLALAIANWRQHLGDMATAADELGRLIPLLESELGADHPDTVTARHLLASLPACGTDPAESIVAATTWFQLYADEQRMLGAERRPWGRATTWRSGGGESATSSARSTRWRRWWRRAGGYSATSIPTRCPAGWHWPPGAVRPATPGPPSLKRWLWFRCCAGPLAMTTSRR